MHLTLLSHQGMGPTPLLIVLGDQNPTSEDDEKTGSPASTPCQSPASATSAPNVSDTAALDDHDGTTSHSTDSAVVYNDPNNPFADLSGESTGPEEDLANAAQQQLEAHFEQAKDWQTVGKTGAQEAQTNATCTILFRPKGKERFSEENRVQTAKALTRAAGGRALAMRINTRLNVAAVDVRDTEAAKNLLSTKTLGSIPVRTTVPQSRGKTSGIIRRLPPSEPTTELLEGLQSTVPVVSIQRLGGGRVARVNFDGELPTHVILWGLRFPVTPETARPLQCGGCGRLGHVRAACKLLDACPTCRGRHPRGTCEKRDTPDCPNCGCRHSAFDRQCTAYRREKCIADLARQNGGNWPAARAEMKAQATKNKQVRIQDPAQAAQHSTTVLWDNGPPPSLFPTITETQTGRTSRLPQESARPTPPAQQREVSARPMIPSLQKKQEAYKRSYSRDRPNKKRRRGGRGPQTATAGPEFSPAHAGTSETTSALPLHTPPEESATDLPPLPSNTTGSQESPAAPLEAQLPSPQQNVNIAETLATLLATISSAVAQILPLLARQTDQPGTTTAALQLMQIMGQLTPYASGSTTTTNHGGQQ